MEKKCGTVIEHRQVLYIWENWKPFPKHYFCSLSCPAHPFQNAIIFHSVEGPSCFNQTVQPSLTICWVTVLASGNHQLSGVTLRLTMRCTRSGYLCNVFQRRHPCLSFLFTNTTSETDFWTCFIVLAAQNEIAIAHRTIPAPKYAQSKSNKTEKIPAIFLLYR